MALLPEVDLDFARYVALRRGRTTEQARGSAYAYVGEHRVRRTLAMAKPVTLAIEATVRLWAVGGPLGAARLGGEGHRPAFPRLYAIASKCAATLHINRPAVYVSPSIGSLNASTLAPTTIRTSSSTPRSSITSPTRS